MADDPPRPRVSEKMWNNRKERRAHYRNLTGGNQVKAKEVLYKRRGEQKKEAIEREEEEIRRLQERYQQIEPANIQTFEDFPLSRKTLQGLRESGFVRPTEIQREVIGLALKGLDVLGASKTGSGKTLAFLIPLLEILFVRKWNQWDSLGALVVSPTRELAQQTYEVLQKVSAHHDFVCRLVVGGKDLKEEREVLGSYQILVCTPGRLLQHMEQNPHLNGDTLQVLVLDEADRCLDPSFQPTIHGIVGNLPPERRMLLFSATQTKSVKDLVRLGLKDPVYVSVHEHASQATPDALRQSYVTCELEHKVDLLYSFIKKHLKKKTIVFLSSCKQVSYIYDAFCKMQPGVSLLRLYGTLHQQKRMEVYEEFCRKKFVVLFATDIASRGLDFPKVDWVVQMDCPEDPETYIHRVGRTARFQAGGESLLVLLPHEEMPMAERLAQKKIPIQKIEVNPSKCVSIRRKLEALLARYVNLKESAQRALVAYVKYVHLMKDKEIFDAGKLDIEGFSRSLGLVATPRVRFWEKHLKEQQARKSMQVKKEQEKPSSFASAFNLDDDSDNDWDVLRVRRVNHDLDGEGAGMEKRESNKQRKKREKIVTKEDVVKKLRNKKIVLNKKITFDDEGEAVIDATKEKMSQAAKEYEKEAEELGGIDIEKAKLVMQEEDQVDKKIYRERVRAKRKMKKLKEAKGWRKEENEEEYSDGEKNYGESDGDDSDGDESDGDESDGDESSGEEPDLSWLPDPDKVYNESDGSESEPEEPIRPTKRKLDTKEPAKKKKSKTEESGLSLMDAEELAANLLKGRKW